MSKPRSFKLNERLATDGAVMDVPHLSFLRHSSISELVHQFQNAWGGRPKAVCIPVCAPDGLNLKVQGTGLPQSSFTTDRANGKEFGQVVAEIAKENLDIYLLLDPTLNFANTATLHIRDLTGAPSSAVCLGNPRSQELLGAILGTALDEAIEATKGLTGKVAGMVLDAVDLWPMGAEKNRINLTCFCSSCEKYISLRDPGLLEKFKTFPNPSNLLLRDSGSGISHIHDINPDSSEDHILGLSKQKDFTVAFGDITEATLRSHASALMRYLQVRHNQTIEAAAAIFDEATNGLDSAVSRVILTSGFTYDWTSGLFLHALDTAPSESCTEVWFDPQESDIFLKTKPFRSYMWTRSRYYIDAFFSFAGNVSSPQMRSTTGIAKFPKEVARELLRRRFSQAIGASISEQAALASLPPLNDSSANESSTRIGFVGVAMNTALGAKFIDGIDIPPGLEEAGGLTKRDLMAKLRDISASGGEA